MNSNTKLTTKEIEILANQKDYSKAILDNYYATGNTELDITEIISLIDNERYIFEFNLSNNQLNY